MTNGTVPVDISRALAGPGESPFGWVGAGCIAVSPARYVTEKKTAEYAWNDAAAPVFAPDGGTQPAVLKEEAGWEIVSPHGAAGWVQKERAPVPAPSAYARGFPAGAFLFPCFVLYWLHHGNPARKKRGAPLCSCPPPRIPRCRTRIFLRSISDKRRRCV